jgi:hypothetical protein
MNVIIYTRSDGGMSVFWPTSQDAEFLSRAVTKLETAGNTNVQIVDQVSIPSELSALPTLDQKATAEIDGMDRLQFEHLFDLENRVRVLEGKGQITRAQYRDALIARWKAIYP